LATLFIVQILLVAIFSQPIVAGRLIALHSPCIIIIDVVPASVCACSSLLFVLFNPFAATASHCFRLTLTFRYAYESVDSHKTISTQTFRRDSFLLCTNIAPHFEPFASVARIALIYEIAAGFGNFS
jgi:hypothetical protein